MLLGAGPTHEGQEGLVGVSTGRIYTPTAGAPIPLPLPGVLKKRLDKTHSSSGWSLTLHHKFPFPNVPNFPSWGPKLAPALPMFALIRAGCSGICAEVGRAMPMHASSGSVPQLPFKHERNPCNSAFLVPFMSGQSATVPCWGWRPPALPRWRLASRLSPVLRLDLVPKSRAQMFSLGNHFITQFNSPLSLLRGICSLCRTCLYGRVIPRDTRPWSLALLSLRNS